MTTAAATVSSARWIDILRFRRRVCALCMSIMSVSGITMPGVGGLGPASVGDTGTGRASLCRTPSIIGVAACPRSKRGGAFERNSSSTIVAGCLRLGRAGFLDASPSVMNARCLKTGLLSIARLATGMKMGSFVYTSVPGRGLTGRKGPRLCVSKERGGYS